MRKFSIATGLALALCSAPVFADHHEDGGEGNPAVDNAMQAIQDLLQELDDAGVAAEVNEAIHNLADAVRDHTAEQIDMDMQQEDERHRVIDDQFDAERETADSDAEDAHQKIDEALDAKHLEIDQRQDAAYEAL